MERLVHGGAIVQWSKGLFELLDRLIRKTGSARKALKEIDEFIRSRGQPSAKVAKILKDLDLEVKDVRKELQEHRDDLARWVGPVAELGSFEHAWPLSKSIGTGSGQGGKESLELTGSLQGVLESDSDGQILEGAVKFDRDRSTIVRMGAVGKLTSKFEHSGALGGIGATAAFGGGGELSVGNYFLHSNEETALTAVLEDITDFRMPFTVDDAGDLRSGIVGEESVPRQWIHLQAKGNIQIGAGLKWGPPTLSTALSPGGGFEAGDIVKIDVDAGAEVSFTQAVSGTYDILMSAAEEPGRIKVALSRSKTAALEAGFRVGADIEIEGLDRIGRAVLGKLTPRIDRLVKPLQENAEKYGDLQKLLDSALDEKLEQELARAEIVDQIQGWIREIIADFDLKKELKGLAKEKLIGMSSKTVEKLQRPTTKAVEEIKDLIRKYQGGLKKINGLLDKAAEIKIGIGVQRMRKKLESMEVALSFVIDPGAEPGLLRRMLRGDFAEAIRRAATPDDPAIRFEEGHLLETGSLQDTVDFNLTVFGVRLGKTTILTQEWETEVSLNGDISIGVKTSLMGKSFGWHKVRTMKFLADSKVIATIGEAGVLIDPDVTDRFAMELGWILKNPKVEAVEEHLVLMQSLELFSEIPSLVKDAARTSPGGSHPFGDLQISALLDLEERHLRNLVSMPASTVRRVFAGALAEHVLPRFRVLDSETGLPVFLWASVQNEKRLITGSASPHRTLVFTEDSRQGTVQYSREEQVLLFNGCRWINSFDAAMARLRQVDQKFVAVGDRKEVLKKVRRAHRDIMKAVRPLIKSDRAINYAFFQAVRTLSDPAGEIDVVIAARRLEDEKIFVY